MVVLFLIACTENNEVPLAPESVETNDAAWVLSLAPNPDPPVAGEAALVIGVAGAADSGAVDAASVTALVPWMPDHDHGVSNAAITDNGDDTYTVDWIYTMSGYWELTITLDDGAEAVVGYEVQ